MSSIRNALEKLDQAVEKLDYSVAYAEKSYGSLSKNIAQTDMAFFEEIGNVIDVDFMAARLDHAIATVEDLLREDKE